MFVFLRSYERPSSRVIKYWMYVVYVGRRLYDMWYLYMIGRLYDFYDGVACCIPLLTGTVYLNVAAKVINHNR